MSTPTPLSACIAWQQIKARAQDAAEAQARAQFGTDELL
jgi:hypothetical protein